MDEDLIGDRLWQHGRHRRIVGACFVVLRRDCTWAELDCFVPSAEAGKRRFRRWAKKGV